MMLLIKDKIRGLLNFLHLDLTKNLRYDRLTRKIIQQFVKPDFNTIDVGAHRGEILSLLIRQAPHGRHFAFEPIPDFAKQLREKFKSRATVYACALSNHSGESTFQYVVNAPAYSGLKNRQYATDKPEITQLKVAVKELDSMIDPELKIDFIKIDVEGGELNVLKGAKRILINNRPIILFECGLGASEYYNTKPGDIFQFLRDDCGYSLFTLDQFLSRKGPLSLHEFSTCFDSGSEYYFAGSPGNCSLPIN